ncbi:hypothetical protein ASG81_08205 [Paenibacillus sp. Soil522]|nr:hypothetical protein ASG81_08205 [Paenibacillus sp. Soil522]
MSNKGKTNVNNGWKSNNRIPTKRICTRAEFATMLVKASLRFKSFACNQKFFRHSRQRLVCLFCHNNGEVWDCEWVIKYGF